MNNTLTIDPIAKSKSARTELSCKLQVLKKGEVKESFQKMFRILNQEEGDKRVVWDSNSLREINEAKNLFDELVQQGMVPYEVDPKGGKSSKEMAKFDPGAEEIIFAPIGQLVGG